MPECAVATFRLYVRYQAMMLLFGAVGPAFLVGYFLLPTEPSTRWLYWWGLFITAADVLAALWLTHRAVRAGR